MPAHDDADQIAHEAVIVGAGPAGLWAAFQLGLHGVISVVIDSNAQAGGQCAALYADKPVYDLPGFGAIEAGQFASRLVAQVERFQPSPILGEHVVAICKTQGSFEVTTRSGMTIDAPYVVLATGLGPFGPGAFGIAAKPPALVLPDAVLQQNGHIAVTPDACQTACEDLYAIGDAVDYQGKLCLLVSAFHEAALMAFSIRKKRAGYKRSALEYTSTSSSLKALFTSR